MVWHSVAKLCKRKKLQNSENVELIFSIFFAVIVVVFRALLCCVFNCSLCCCWYYSSSFSSSSCCLKHFSVLVVSPFARVYAAFMRWTVSVQVREASTWCNASLPINRVKYHFNNFRKSSQPLPKLKINRQLNGKLFSKCLFFAYICVSICVRSTNTHEERVFKRLCVCVCACASRIYMCVSDCLFFLLLHPFSFPFILFTRYLLRERWYKGRQTDSLKKWGSNLPFQWRLKRALVFLTFFSGICASAYRNSLSKKILLVLLLVHRIHLKDK